MPPFQSARNSSVPNPSELGPQHPASPRRAPARHGYMGEMEKKKG
jgi:hypothetical protein